MKDWKKIGTLVLAGLLVSWGMAGTAAAMEVKVSGQVNQMISNINDGDKEETFIGDNDNSGTRIRFTAEEDLGSVKAGVKLEMDAQRNASNTWVIDYDSANDDGGWEWKDRVLNAYLVTNFGSFEIGKGDGAANNTSEVDLSGTDIAIKSDAQATLSSIEWKDENGVATGVTVGDTQNNFDGLSRNDRVRYNTPNFAGVVFSASVTNDDAYEAAITYSAAIAGKLAAAIGYVDSGQREVDDDYTQIGASVSWLAPFGLNVTAAYGMRSYESDSAMEDLDPTNFYIKLGYKFGIHAVAIDYGSTDELLAESVTESNYGLAYVVKPWSPVELYAAYRVFMLDVDEDYYADDIENITQVFAGMRIKF